ncbi:MAG TPA: prephenate dehydratase [Actinomycetota bacterium]|nr:prephenate dehydratase [Actinomycetota bacterium]
MGGRFGFLGPPGTFTQEALLQVADPESAELVYYPSVEEVVLAVDRGDVDRGMVPMENSVEGTVNATVDALGFDTQGLIVEKEVILPVRLHLLARPGADLLEIKQVYSMPHATAQCRKWLRDNLPEAKAVAANSTAEAAGRVAYETGPADKAAIGPSLAAHLYGLQILARDVTDHAEAETRFVVVGREMPPATGRDKTSLVCFIAEDRPGALLEILQCFVSQGINLTKVESRPTKRVLGEYCFFIDLEGHSTDPGVAAAMSEVEARVARLKLLGSYPRALGALDAERLARRARGAKARPGDTAAVRS